MSQKKNQTNYVRVVTEENGSTEVNDKPVLTTYPESSTSTTFTEYPRYDSLEDHIDSAFEERVKVKNEPQKSRFVAAFFAFVFSALGVNELYTRHTTVGVLELILSIVFCWTLFVPLVITVINLIRGCQYLWCNSDDEFNRKFCN